MKKTIRLSSIPLFPETFKVLLLSLFFIFGTGAGESLADSEGTFPRTPYVSPPYVAPLPPPISRIHLIDNGDGTISAPGTGLMWAQKDSYADLGRCLDWYQASKYVKNLRAGGHTDWRLPTINELLSIYDITQENPMSWDHDPGNPLRLDEKFADGAAYLYWSSYEMDSKSTDCCGKSLYFVNGTPTLHRFTMCLNSGVRAVRKMR
jgi:uncharacterized protein DUF1566